MKNIRVLLSLLIVALLAVGFVTGCGDSGDDGGGTDTGNVTGTVIDNNGTAVSGATCTVTTTDLKAVYTDTTDADGLFLITGITTGTWPLTISKTGYQTISVNVTVGSGSTTEVPADETVITPSSGVGVVTGTVSDATSAVVIEGAAVAIGTFSTTSSATGAYTLSGVTAGAQTITASKTGYESYTSTVTVVADTTVTKNIAMTSSAPEPGKGHVTGKVIDENSNALSGVTVTSGTTTATTDSNGEYTLMNLDPGAVTVSYAKTGYDSTTQSVTVVADQTVTANTVTMTTGIATGTTTIVSKPYKTEVGGGTTGSTISDNGAYVAFITSEQLRTYVITNGIHIYLYDRSSGTVSVLDMTPNGATEGTFQNGNATATGAFISGDASKVAFATNADNLIGTGADSNKTSDIFVYDRATGVNTRVSVDFTSPLVDTYINTDGTTANGADSFNPGLSQDGSYCVFDSNAYNIIAKSNYTDLNGAGAGLHGNRNVYRVKLTTATSGAVTVSQQRLVSGRQADGLECRPLDWGLATAIRTSTNPYISRDGKYVVYESNAFLVAGAGAALLNALPNARFANADRDIVKCDMDLNYTNMTSFVSYNANGAIQASGGSNCTNPTISDDGTKVAFQCADNNVWKTGTNGTISDIWVKNMSSNALDWITNNGQGTRGNSFNAMISRDGTLVVFDSLATGFVQNDTNASADIFVYTVSGNTYERVNLNNNDEQTETTGAGSTLPFISGDNNYVSFDSTAKNLYTGDGSVYFTAGCPDIYLRKWQ